VETLGDRNLPDPSATSALGCQLGHEAVAGDVFALVGDLGAGKTHFAKGLAQGIGYEGDVTSPTFSLVHEYRGGRLPVFHFDFYRIESADELIAIGWDDYLDQNGVVIVEWADKFTELMPAATRWLHFAFEPDGTRSVREAPR
jgi:tRNA threonylcarbamoyladenosine biosynthesis protein TsaE